MNTRNRGLTAPLLCLALIALPGCLDLPRPSGHEDRIARIESEVMPTFVAEGREPPPVSLEQRMTELRVPGVSVAVWTEGQLAWARGYGDADVAVHRAVLPSTLFQAASISKPVAAMVILDLVEEGVLDLDADVNGYLTHWKLPENGYADSAKVTLRRLLSHSAGTTVWGFPGYARTDTIPSTAQVLAGAGNTDPVVLYRSPGAGWQYSGGGYTVAQFVVEEVTGRPFAEVAAERVLGPVGMRASTYRQPLPADRWDDAATGYREDGASVEGSWHVYPEQAAAGLWTTPSDLARYAMSVQRSLGGSADEVLDPSTAREMLEPVAGSHGLGPMRFDDGVRFGHGGSNEGFRCGLSAWMDGGRGIAVMTNSDAGGLLASELILTIARAYGWDGPEQQRKTVVQLPPEALQAVTGRYQSPDVGEFEIVAADGSLEVRSADLAAPWIFHPASETEFFKADDGRTLRFELVQGRAIACTFVGVARAERIE